MKDVGAYNKLRRQNKRYARAGLASFIIGETRKLHQYPALCNINTVLGLALSLKSMEGAFRMLDLLDGSEGDESYLLSILKDEFLMNPLTNAFLLGYSNSSPATKKELRNMLKLDSLEEFFV